MKKKVLAMLLGGVMAVGGLSMSASMTAQAAPVTEDVCNWHTEAHIESSEVSVVDGKLAVTITLKEFGGFAAGYTGSDEPGFSLVALEKYFPNPDWYDDINGEMIPLGWPDEMCMWAKRESGTYIFEELPAGKTYYVYCVVYDHEPEGEGSFNDHDVICLGSGTPTAGPADTPSTDTPADKPADTPTAGTPSVSTSVSPAQAAETAVINQIQSAEAGSTVTLDKGTTTLSNAVMKELLKKGDVSLKLEYTYNDQDYVVVIPAGAALDNDIPWYGPLYLAQQYGNSAGTGAAATAPGAGTSYEVKSGDRLGKIAAVNNMTLKQLLEKNPQIKDANKIKVGQKINL